MEFFKLFYPRFFCVCDRDMGVVSRDFAEAGWRRVGSAQGSREVDSETKKWGLAFCCYCMTAGRGATEVH